MKLVLVAFAMFGALAVSGCGDDDDDTGGTSNPVEACKSGTAVICKKFFNGCYTAAELQQAAPIIGNNEADCNTKFGAECTVEGTKCDSGQTFKPDQAEECVKQYDALSCNELKAQVEPAACALVCG